MTRLAIIFSLLFVTPAWAETITIRCGYHGYWAYYKYEEGIFYDTCYVRRNGSWNKGARAENHRCYNPDGTVWVDFIDRGTSSGEVCQRKLKSGEWQF